MPQLMNADDCGYDGKPIRISDSAMIHLLKEKIPAFTLCDMLASPVECPKLKKTGKPFRKNSRRVCSMRKGRIYNIILDPYNDDGTMYWSVSHLEPI